MAVKDNLSLWEAESEGLELIRMTTGQLLDRRADSDPEKEALVYSYPELGINFRLNFRQYREEVDRLAKGLLALGVQKGENVGIFAPNLPQWIFLELAATRIGAVLLTINTAYRANELEYVLRQGDVTVLFMTEEFRGNSYLDSLYSIAPELKQLAEPAHQDLQSEKLPRLRKAVLLGQVERPGCLLYSQVLELGRPVSDEQLRQRIDSVSPDDVAMILYTSGTTGFPKGAMLTHYNLINTMVMNSRDDDYSQDRYLNPMPLFHVAGGNFIFWCLLHGVTLIPLIAFDPAKTLELMHQEKATLSFLVPTMLLALLNHPRFVAGEFDLSHLRRVYSGGTIVPVALLEQVRDKIGSDVCILFGQTESTGAGTTSQTEDNFDLKAGTIGKAYPNMSLKVIEPMTGQVVPLGEPGELLMKGFAVMRGYYNMAQKTADTIDEDGWLHTGDLTTLDEHGYVRIAGRLKDMIIRGGENIYPAEIENFLMRHPKIADAQVIGVPDSRVGEEVVALLRLKPDQTATEEEILEYCRNGISRFKNPKYIRFVTEYPLTASGKIKKYELRAQVAKELGLAV